MRNGVSAGKQPEDGQPKDEQPNTKEAEKYNTNISNERQQFRIDVCPELITVPDDQWREDSAYPPKAAKLHDLAQPQDGKLRGFARWLGNQLTNTFEKVLTAIGGSSSNPSPHKVARRSMSMRLTQKEVKRQRQQVSPAVALRKQRLGEAWQAMCSSEKSQEMDLAQSMVAAKDMFALMAVEVLDRVSAEGLDSPEMLQKARIFTVGETLNLAKVVPATRLDEPIRLAPVSSSGGSVSPAPRDHIGCGDVIGKRRRRSEDNDNPRAIVEEESSTDRSVPRGSVANSDCEMATARDDLRQALASQLISVMDTNSEYPDVAADINEQLKKLEEQEKKMQAQLGQNQQLPYEKMRDGIMARDDYVAHFSLTPHGMLGESLPIGEAVPPIVGICSTIPVNDEPFADAFGKHLVAATTHIWKNRPNMRFCWGIVLQPGTARVCLFESDTIHVSDEMDLKSAKGRLMLTDFYARICLSESWRMGADPTMKWHAELDRWEIQCPDDVDADTTRSVFAEARPFFSAESYFGRATRCFKVSLTPHGKVDHVLKDSWQLVVADDAEHQKSADSEGLAGAQTDEIHVLRTIRDKLEAEQSDVTYPKLMCGGTVSIVTGGEGCTPLDNSELILGDFSHYCRWTVPHGHNPSQRLQFNRAHRRMVTGPIGVPISSLANEHDLLMVLVDAMRAHTEISRVCGFLHRDISLNNILAVRTASGKMQGMLIDYDHAVEADAPINQKRPGHIGTGPFMSIANLEGQDIPRTVIDDWESLIYLLFCLGGRQDRFEEMSKDFTKVNRHTGVAEPKRHLFSSPAHLEQGIKRYVDPSFTLIIHLIRVLYEGVFQHPKCHGTTQIGLSRTRTVDPISRRVMHADEIQTRCMKAMEKAATEISKMWSLQQYLKLAKQQPVRERFNWTPIREEAEDGGSMADSAAEGSTMPAAPAASVCSEDTADSMISSVASTLPAPPSMQDQLVVGQDASKPQIKDIARTIMHMKMRRNKRKADVSGCYKMSPKQKRRRLSTFSDLSMHSVIQEEEESDWSVSPVRRRWSARHQSEDIDSPRPSKRLCFD